LCCFRQYSYFREDENTVIPTVTLFVGQQSCVLLWEWVGIVVWGSFVVQNKRRVYYYSEQWNISIFKPLSLAFSPLLFLVIPHSITTRYKDEKESPVWIIFSFKQLRFRVKNILQYVFSYKETYTGSGKTELKVQYAAEGRIRILGRSKNLRPQSVLQFYTEFFEKKFAKHRKNSAGLEDLTAVIMKSSTAWDITPCKLCSICHLLSSWFLTRLILRPWTWRRCSSETSVDLKCFACHLLSRWFLARLPKRRLIFNGLHGVITQKTERFMENTGLQNCRRIFSDWSKCPCVRKDQRALALFPSSMWSRNFSFSCIQKKSAQVEGHWKSSVLYCLLISNQDFTI
jgi:hypothetical protein